MSEERCITCGDIALVATVVEAGATDATVEIDGRDERVAVDLVGPVEVGDRLLCHAGIALQRVA